MRGRSTDSRSTSSSLETTIGPGHSSSAASALFRQLGDAHGIALALYGLAVTRPAGAEPAAREQALESLDILRAVGDRRTFAKVLWNLAEIDADLGDTDSAAEQLAESLTLFIEFGDRWFSELVLESAAFLAAATGDAERAVRLLGAADTVLEAIGVPLDGAASGTSRPRSRRGAQRPRGEPLRGRVGGWQAAPARRDGRARGGGACARRRQGVRMA